jgi:hypothetical protein
MMIGLRQPSRIFRLSRQDYFDLSQRAGAYQFEDTVYLSAGELRTHHKPEQFRQLRDVGRDPPRLGRMYAGRGHKNSAAAEISWVLW